LEIQIYGCTSDNFTDIKSFFDQFYIQFLKKNTHSINQLKKLNNLMHKLNKIELLDYHFSIAKRQRESYNFLKNNLTEDSIFLEFDFKEKIKIGLSPEQVSQEFYNLKTRFVLGMFIQYFYILSRIGDPMT